MTEGKGAHRFPFFATGVMVVLELPSGPSWSC